LAENSDTVQFYRVLYTAYEITKGFQMHPLIIQQIAAILGYDINDYPKYLSLVEVFSNLQNKGLLRSRPKLGIVLTNLGINEIEATLLESSKSTSHFPAGIVRFVDVDASLLEFISKLQKARRDYLNRVYQAANGFVTVVVESFNVKDILGIDDETFKRVYYYLEEAGFIKFVHSGGISITHLGKAEIENRNIIQSTKTSFWQSHYPDITITDDIVHVIDKINSACSDKLGFEIFNNKATPIVELRKSINSLNNDSKDKNAFVTCLLSIAAILGDIKNDEIKKHLSNKDLVGPLYLIEELFTVKGMKYDKSDFSMLRKLVGLRSKIPPVHLAEAEFSQILQSIGVEYPVLDWAKAADTCIKIMLRALNGIYEKLAN